MNLAIEVLEHFYTTDFFQPSKFKEMEQVVSVYYLVRPLENISEYLFRKNLDLEEVKKVKQQQLFRWIDWKEFGPSHFQLPIDKVVAGKMKLQLK